MPIIRNRQHVLELYSEAAENKWVIPCFCSENLTTTEAILSGVKDYGDLIGKNDLPITVAMTNLYPPRPQSTFYSHTGKWNIGLRLFLKDAEILLSKQSPYSKLRVMLHLDHIQPTVDAKLLKWDMKQFSSIMFDASNYSFEDNIRMTTEFVEKEGKHIVIEGACDEITDAGGNEISNFTTPEKAERFLSQTGCNFIVANLGTEHRASTSELKYHGEVARNIKKRIGSKIVLHGGSSVIAKQIRKLFSDGICKANIWTILELNSTHILFKEMVKNAPKLIGSKAVNEILPEYYPSSGNHLNTKPDINYFTTSYRQYVVFTEMKKIVTRYLQMWYTPTLG
jgi:fructose/tagatose bisphosphate aldolase